MTGDGDGMEDPFCPRCREMWEYCVCDQAADTDKPTIRQMAAPLLTSCSGRRSALSAAAVPAAVPVWRQAAGTDHGLKDAATARDPAAFARHWWGRGALYNLGEVTSRRFDVDTGPAGSGWEAFNRLKEAGLLTGAVRLVRTPSGGLHVYFAASGQRSVSLKGLHLDFKALGGYVLVPPSQIGGRRYEVLDERPPTGRTLDWDAAKRLLVPPRPYRAPRSWRGSQQHLVTWLEGVPGGNRNNSLFWAVCKALEAGDEDTADQLADVALAAGLGADEVRKTVESARRAADDAAVTSTRSRTGRWTAWSPGTT